jgi:hypothetical protein
VQFYKIRRRGNMSNRRCEIDQEDGNIAKFKRILDVKKCQKSHICTECGRTIEVGESYECAHWFCYGNKMHIYKTCRDCEIARRVFFGKDYFVYTEIWDAIYEKYRSDIPESCMSKLTKYHRERLCEEIEQKWEEEE